MIWSVSGRSRRGTWRRAAGGFANVVVFSRLDVAGAGGVIGVFVFQCVDDADCSGIAALLVGQDGAGVGEHHVVLGLQALVQASLLALRPGALDERLSVAAAISLNVTSGSPRVFVKQKRAYASKASMVSRLRKSPLA